MNAPDTAREARRRRGCTVTVARLSPFDIRAIKRAATLLAFAGLTLWAPMTGPGDLRVPTLILLHVFGMWAGLIASSDAFWTKRR